MQTIKIHLWGFWNNKLHLDCSQVSFCLLFFFLFLSLFLSVFRKSIKVETNINVTSINSSAWNANPVQCIRCWADLSCAVQIETGALFFWPFCALCRFRCSHSFTISMLLFCGVNIHCLQLYKRRSTNPQTRTHARNFNCILLLYTYPIEFWLCVHACVWTYPMSTKENHKPHEC